MSGPKRSLLYQGNDEEMRQFVGDRFAPATDQAPASVQTGLDALSALHPGQYVVIDHLDRISVVDGDKLGGALL